MESKRRKSRHTHYFDYNLLFGLIVLIIFGLVMLYSSSSYSAANHYNDSAHYLKLQLRNLLVGLIPFLVMVFVDYRIWKPIWPFLYVASIVLCILAAIPGIGSDKNGSSRWLAIGPISFQPSELAKIAIIFTLAACLEAAVKQMGKLKAVMIMLGMSLPLAGIVAYGNLSTAIIMLGIAFCMIFISSPKIKPFFIAAVVIIVLAVIMLLVKGYRGNRVATWTGDMTTLTDDNYQTLQGLYAIGSGGLFGKGLGQSMQKLGNVPESQNDFIFTIICEELGIIGALCVILIYSLILWRMMFIAMNAEDMYGSMLVVGVMAHIAIQVVLNIAVVTNTIPNTGVTLPFISYGGTSIVMLMTEMGLVLGVSRQIKLEEIK